MAPQGLLLLVSLLAFSSIDRFVAGETDPLVVTVTYAGHMYAFFQSDEHPASARQKCQALGGDLVSFNSKNEAVNTVWSSAALAKQEYRQYWTGLKVTWPAKGRKLQSFGRDFVLSRNVHDEVAPHVAVSEQGSASDASADAAGFILAGERTLLEGSVSGDSLIRALPKELLQWQDIKERRKQRALQAAFDGDDRINLAGAVFSWSDGSTTKLITDNKDNLAFLTCDKFNNKECCGLVYDVPPEEYPGSPFPAIFFYPCNHRDFPANYMCEVGTGGEGQLPNPSGTPRPTNTPAPTNKPCHKLKGKKNRKRCNRRNLA